MKTSQTKSRKFGEAFRLCAPLGMVASKLFNRPNSSTNTFNAAVSDNIVGTPAINAMEMDGPQAYPDTCAIKAQELILERYTNTEISEDSLVEYAHQMGWYTPGGGTPIPHVGKLLEESGIPITQRQGANIFDIYKELAEGKQIIIGVDGSELRGENKVSEFFEEFLGGEQADHAVVVSGINTATNEVIITDPATGMTNGYSFDELTEAWSDSSFFMMNTNMPAPRWVPGMEDFDYVSGHIEMIQGVPFDSFAQASSNVFTAPEYISLFDLSDFLEIAPRSYGILLSDWSVTTANDFPSDGLSLCVSDHEWLAETSSAIGSTMDVRGIPDGESFFDLARDIFDSLS